ncbi:MAG: hypothetical protein VB997_07970, partial [Opitutales bacterium]
DPPTGEYQFGGADHLRIANPIFRALLGAPRHQQGDTQGNRQLPHPPDPTTLAASVKPTRNPAIHSLNYHYEECSNEASHAFCVVIASPSGCGNPVGIVTPETDTSAGSPRQDYDLPRHDKAGQLYPLDCFVGIMSLLAMKRR